jgi:Flp pilus assembly protein CpaB
MSILNRLSQPGGGNKERTLLIVAIALGLVAFIGNWVYLIKAEGKQLVVMRAQKFIPAGAPLDESHFDAVVIAGDLGKMKSLFVAKEDIGAFRNQTLTESLQPGQLLTLRSFILDGAGISCCPDGKRAISIEVRNEADGVAFAIRPGHAVDLWGNVNGQAVLLKKHALVKAIGGSYLTPNQGETQRESYRSVTILVNEKEVECLVTNLWLADGKTWFILASDYNPNAEAPAAACQSVPQGTSELYRNVPGMPSGLNPPNN